MHEKSNVFIVWKKYQRRVEVLAPHLNLEVKYFHYSWEEKSKLNKAASYLFKSAATLMYLFQKRPSFILVQFPPTPALYCVAFYCWVSGTKYISDSHFVVGNEQWLKWIFARKLLQKNLILVHNEDIAAHVKKRYGFHPFVLRDGIAPNPTNRKSQSDILNQLSLSAKEYVFLPWTFSSDEPLLELFLAAKALPEVKFVMTWYSERLPGSLRQQVPPNVILSGFLPVEDFNHLFDSAGIVVVLTQWEAIQLSGMQEAMAFEIPAVVSDLHTTRQLYGDAPVYVANTPDSIADGIRSAFNHRDELSQKMKMLKLRTMEEFNSQVTELKKIVNLDY